MNKRIETLREIFLEMANLVTAEQMSAVTTQLQTDYATVLAYLQGQIQDKGFAEKLLAALKKQFLNTHASHIEAYAERLELINEILEEFSSYVEVSIKLVKTVNSKLQQLDKRLTMLQDSNISPGK